MAEKLYHTWVGTRHCLHRPTNDANALGARVPPAGDHTMGISIAQENGVATPTYSLIRPVLGFWEDQLTVVKIPAGAKVQVAITKNDVGLCAASWDGRIFMAFVEDIRGNGTISGESLGGFTHTT